MKGSVGLGLGFLLLQAAPGVDPHAPGPAPSPGVAQEGTESAGEAGEPVPDAGVLSESDLDAPAKELLAALQGLAERAPDGVRFETLCHRPAGEPVQLVIFRGASGVDRPTVLWVEGRGWDLAEARRWVARLDRWVRSLGQGGVLDGVLEAVDLAILPLPTPEALGGDPPRLRFDRNFPMGWLPDPLQRGGGLRPLADPTVRALVEWLQGHPEVALVCALQPFELGRPAVETPIPVEDAAELERLNQSGGEATLPWTSVRSPGGGILDHAVLALGIPALAIDPGAEEAALDRTLAGLVASLPALDLTVVATERISADTWRVDLEVSNPRPLATSTLLADERSGGRFLQVELSGGQGIALASLDGTSGEVELLPAPESRLRLGRVEGGARQRWSLFVRSSAGQRLEVKLTSPWAGTATTALDLPP